MSTPTRRSRTSKPQTTTGAVAQSAPVAEVVCPSAPRRNLSGSAAVASNPLAQHQTHGAVTPLRGGVTNVSQIINGGRNVAKGSAGSFETLAEYTTYLRTLDLHGLHRHAREDARIVPIDDRERLIRRLETAWTTTASRYPGRANQPVIPARAPFSREQTDAQEEIRRKLLKV